MTDIGYSEPPEPPAGQVWCMVCLMHAKGAQQMKAAALLKQLEGRNGADDGRRHWIEWDHAAPLRFGAYRAMSEVPQLGIVDTCWHHMAGIGEQPAASAVLAAGGPIPPGLLKGRG